MYARLSAGSGFAFLAANVGTTVARSAVEAAFEEDTGGAKVVLNCGSGCSLSEVWTAWGADPVTLEPTTTGVDYPGDDPCESCDSVTLLAWSQDDGSCP